MVIKGGYIKLYRKFFAHDLWREARVYSKAEAWIDIMASANYTTRSEARVGAVMIVIGRGEWLASVRFLGERWGWSRSKVGRFLSYLIGDGMIDLRPLPELREQVIVISNYGLYNPIDPEAEQIWRATKRATNQSKNEPQKEPCGEPRVGLVNSYDSDGYEHDQFEKSHVESHQTSHEDEKNEPPKEPLYKKDIKKGYLEEELKDTHTHSSSKNSSHARVSARAEELLGWIIAECPHVRKMDFPITPQQAESIVGGFSVEDYRRVFSDMERKEAWRKTRYAWATFKRWAQMDIVMRERRKEPAVITDPEKLRRHQEALRRSEIADNKQFNRLYAEGIRSGAIKAKPEK